MCFECVLILFCVLVVELYVCGLELVECVVVKIIVDVEVVVFELVVGCEVECGWCIDC